MISLMNKKLIVNLEANVGVNYAEFPITMVHIDFVGPITQIIRYQLYPYNDQSVFQMVRVCSYSDLFAETVAQMFLDHL